MCTGPQFGNFVVAVLYLGLSKVVPTFLQKLCTPEFKYLGTTLTNHVTITKKLCSLHAAINSSMKMKMYMYVEYRWNGSDGENRITRRKTCFSDTFHGRSQCLCDLRHVCGHLLPRISVSNFAGAWMPVSCECCVLSGRGLCDGLIARPEESYRLRVNVIECDQVQQ